LKLALPLILLLTLLLRVPSLFEPLWYGDEGISLTVAQVIRRGALLYRDIHDNKPPLFYLLLALQPTLRWAKVLATLLALLAQGAVYLLARKLLSRRGALIAALCFGVLAAVPPLEGNIANGEIFLLFPVTLGFFLGAESGFWRSLGAGACFALATLLKIPAVFDFLAFLAFWFLVVPRPHPRRSLAFVLGGFALPWLLVLAYFAARHSLPFFLDSVVFYNLRYVGMGEGLFPFSIKPFLLAFLLLAVFSTWALRNRFSSTASLLFLWFSFSLAGALLSGRPYPHYLLQALPSLALLCGLALSRYPLRERLLGLGLVISFFTLLGFLPFYRYPLFAYYRNFGDYWRGAKSVGEYWDYFDWRTGRKYRLAQYVRENTAPGTPILVWGNEPGLYFLASRPPATKFIAYYHVMQLAKEAELWRQLAFNPPALIIATGDAPALPPEELSQYQLVAEFDGAQILARRSD